MISEIKFNNDIMLAKLQALPVSGEYKIEVAMIPPMDGSSEKPTTGVLLLEDSDEVLDIPELLVDDFETKPQQMLLELSNYFCDIAGSLPEVLVYVGEDTRRLLVDYCLKTNIKLIPADLDGELINFLQNSFSDYEEDYSDWEDAADEYELSDEERAEVIIEALMMFTDEEIQAMEPEFLNEARDIVNIGGFPPEIEKEFRRKLGMDGADK